MTVTPEADPACRYCATTASTCQQYPSGCCPDCFDRTHADFAAILREIPTRFLRREMAERAIDGEAAEAELRALHEQLTAAHNVIRRFIHGWMPDAEPVGEETFNRWYLESGIDDTDIGGTEPMTDAEADALRAATADPTPLGITPQPGVIIHNALPADVTADLHKSLANIADDPTAGSDYAAAHPETP